MILDPALTAAYVVLAAALAISPGPDVLFVIANGVQHRLKGAIAAALGICVGSVFHTLAAALGVSTLIAASPLTFDLVRYGGALYLAYLGFMALRAWYANQLAPVGRLHGQGEASLGKVFSRGLITNLLNPKMVVFYLALLPQFVNVELGNVGLQIFLLGSIHNLIGLIFLIGIGMATGAAANWIGKTTMARWLDGLAGLFYLGLALRLFLSD